MRDLYNDILSYKGDDILPDVLSFWVEVNDYQAYLEELAEKIGAGGDPAELPVEDSWELYALSRVLDTLTLRFQPDRKADGSDWAGPELTVAEYVEFVQMLGLEALDSVHAYAPFYFEIFEAVAGDVNFHLSETLFPPVVLKNLLIKRGGARITLNASTFDLDAVNNSTIYWAYRRKNRKCQDLSHGWGSNSQWRTDFRFDFDLGDTFLYNAEGGTNLNSPTAETLDELNKNGLSLSEAIELTVTRHFITSKKHDDDQFPYGYKYVERKPAVPQNY